MSDTIPDKDLRPPRQGVRYGFIDMLGGIALVVMIETHVVNAYLSRPLREGGFYFWLSFLNGLVAPTFLFASGFSTMLQGRRHWDAWLRFGAPFWRQMRRLGFILLVGYVIHLQHWRLSEYLAAQDPVELRATLQVDFLQCIAVSLLAVHLLVFVARRKRAFAVCALAAGAAIALATPWVWARDFTAGMPLALALYLNPHGVSLFPLFPWIVFVLAGAVAATLFLEAVERGKDARFMMRLLAAGLLLIPAGLLGRLLPFSLPGMTDFFFTSPLYMMVRLGCVLAITVLLYALEKFLRVVPRPLQTAGQESLFVYVLHLWAIYGVLRSEPLVSVFGREAGLLGSLLLTLGLVFAILWLTREWQELNGRHPQWIQGVRAALVVALVAAFLVA